MASIPLIAIDENYNYSRLYWRSEDQRMSALTPALTIIFIAYFQCEH